MGLQETDFDGDLWFFTGYDSRKTTHIAANPQVNVGHRELMTQHQDLGVLPPRLPPRQPQHRHGPGDDEEDQLQAYKPKIIARQPEPDLPAKAPFA